jgi:hypothetical protein
MGGGVFHELGFLSLYSLSDSRLPILGRNGAGLSRSSGLEISWILCLERSPWNSANPMLRPRVRLSRLRLQAEGYGPRPVNIAFYAFCIFSRGFSFSLVH